MTQYRKEIPVSKWTDAPKLLDKYSFIRKLMTDAAIGSGDTADEACTNAEFVLCTDGVATADVASLDAWLGILDSAQWYILLMGSDEEFSGLIAESPSSTDGGCVGQLLNDIWEIL